MKFLVDMNLTPTWVGFLQENGFEAVHWSRIGAGDASDRALATWAIENDYVVFTADLDFGAILATTRGNKPSVLLLRGEIPTPGAFGQLVLSAARSAREELVSGAILALDARRARLRILPLGGRR